MRVAVLEHSIELNLEMWRGLLEPRRYPTHLPKNYAFWTMAMPNQYERPEYYRRISGWYSRGECDPLGYIDGYHPLIAGSTVFNFFIQDSLIREAAYVVGDISVVRHNSFFEVGFGLGIGAQVRLYFDQGNPIRGQYRREEGAFCTADETRSHLPPQLRDAEVADVPRDRVSGEALGRRDTVPVVTRDKDLKQFIREYVHGPLVSRMRRRDCPKDHLANAPCEFKEQLAGMESSRYFYLNSRDDHRVQGDFVSKYLEGKGLTNVSTIIPGAVKDSVPLCQICFALRSAQYVIVDGTASRNYMVEAAECAFALGMAVAFSRTRGRKRVLPIYEEPAGPLGMFAGGRAGWSWGNWQTDIGGQLDGWLGMR